MFFNPSLILALPLCGLLYVAGRRLKGNTPRLPLVAVMLLTCLPGLSFISYYFHFVREPVWYVEFRSVPCIEVLSALWGLPAGYLEIGRPIKGIETLSGGRPLLRLALALTFIPFCKPILLPVGYLGKLHDRWDGGVCLQSTMATCGPCSLATVFRELGISKSEREIARGAYSAGTGTEDWYLIRYARRSGLEAKLSYDQSPETITPPAILGVKLGGRAGHFIVYLRRDHGRMIIGDPLAGSMVLNDADFPNHYRFSGQAVEFRRK